MRVKYVGGTKVGESKKRTAKFKKLKLGIKIRQNEEKKRN